MHFVNKRMIDIYIDGLKYCILQGIIKQSNKVETRIVSEKNFNIPNILATIRLLLVPVVICLIMADRMTAALIVFLVACATDLLDGYIARKHNLVTRLGIWLDPLADKLMAVSIILCFVLKGILPAFVAGIIFVKEFLMLLGGMLVIRKHKVAPANKFGKIASFILNVAVASGFLYETLSPYYLWVTYVALVFSVIAFIQYVIKNWGLVFKK